jgi:hypothetical protein
LDCFTLTILPWLHITNFKRRPSEIITLSQRMLQSELLRIIQVHANTVSQFDCFPCCVVAVISCWQMQNLWHLNA